MGGNRSRLRKHAFLLLKRAGQSIILSSENDEEQRQKPVNKDEAMETLWTAAEENFLMLARELEWAEAYAADHADCPMGRIYLDFLRWEMISAQAEC